jgi:hypothetical protein
VAAFDEPRWQKADIDGNGYMDLLFNGYLNKDGQSRQCTIVVLSFGADSLLKHEISGANGFFAARLIRYNGQNDIQIHYREAIEDSAQEKGYRLLDREDTLTAFDGRIVELPAPALHHIEKLNVREEGGDDSVAVMGDTIRWYKNEADPPAHKDSINLYLLVDAKTCQKLLTLAAGIRFERLNPDLLLPNKLMRYFSSTWYIEHDGGKQSQFTSDGLIGSYRLQALGNYLWELKRYRNDWKLVSPVHIQQSIR